MMKNTFKFSQIGIKTFFCFILTTTIMGCFAKPADPKKIEQAAADLKKEYSVLAGLKSKIPPISSLTQKSCPDSEIEAKVKTQKKWLKVIPYEYFSVFEGTPTWKEMKKDWQWLYPLDSFPYVEDLRSIKEIHDVQWRTSLLYKESHYLGVLVAPQKNLPKVVTDESYATGLIQGWIVVFDMDSQNVVCQVALKVQNNKDVEFRDRGPLSKDFNEAVLDDFKSQYKTKIQESLQKISNSFVY